MLGDLFLHHPSQESQVCQMQELSRYVCMYQGLPYFPEHFGIQETPSSEEVSLYSRKIQPGKAHSLYDSMLWFCEWSVVLVGVPDRESCQLHDRGICGYDKVMGMMS